MLRVKLESELARIEHRCWSWVRPCRRPLKNSVGCLVRRDMEASRQIIRDDRLVNQRRFAIEADILVLIATQQPMARDLRLLAALLEITMELERIGDYAKGISRINLMIGDRRPDQASGGYPAHGRQGDRHAAPGPARLCRARRRGRPGPSRARMTRWTRCTTTSTAT